MNSSIEFSKIFTSTTNKEIRDYIGHHLVKVGGFEENLQQLWTFLDIILDHPVLLIRHKLPQDNIENLMDQSNKWKAEVAAILFLKTNG